MIVEVKNGAFSYSKDRDILKEINFKLESGKILSILGPNGVGKTTLLKCIMGLVPWKDGSSFLDGVDVMSIKPKILWSNISYIPQVHSFTFSYTGLEMVLIGLSSKLGMFSQPNREDIEFAKMTMKRIGISSLVDKDCNKMSGGELQMVLIARALISNPKVMILDEPETGLDFHNQLLVLSLIKKLVSENSMSAIINTHYPTNALAISDFSFIMNSNGKHIYGSTKEVITPENIEKTFKVKVLMNELIYKGRKLKNILPVDIV